MEKGKNKKDKKENKITPKRHELKFESEGDEYLFLYDIVQKSDYNDHLTDATVTLELLRDIYDIITTDKIEELNKKYEGSKRYWFEEQEEAVVNYILNPDADYRNIIFNKHLYKPLYKLIENIIFSFKLFRSDVDIKSLIHDCQSFLIMKIEKFNPKKRAQAFSYLGTIAKHYLQGDKRTAYKFTKSNVDLQENIDEASSKPDQTYYIEEEDIGDINIQIFDGLILKLEEDIQKPKMLLNDKKVGEAIVYIFRNHQMLEAYNKNKLYLLLKERTGLQTKDITYSLGRFKKEYEIFKSIFVQKSNDL